MVHKYSFEAYLSDEVALLCSVSPGIIRAKQADLGEEGSLIKFFFDQGTVFLPEFSSCQNQKGALDSALVREIMSCQAFSPT